MNKIRTIAFGVFIFALLACEQPFKAGLGPVVDIRPPTVTLTTPFAGGYIFGNAMLFEGTAEDDYILSKVEIQITNHPEIDYLRAPAWYPVTLNKPKQNEGNWEIRLNTKLFEEGDLKIKIKVTDSVGKTSELDEMVFNVKNKQPAISLTTPTIIEGSAPGNIGYRHLNYYEDGSDPTKLPVAQTYQRRVDKDISLVGSIGDAQGIYDGEETADRFPPQIRIWRVDVPGDPDNKIYAPGTLPSYDRESGVPWENFRMEVDPKDEKPVNLIPLQISNEGKMTYGQFSYRLSEIPGLEPGQFYGIEIRAQSVDNDGTIFHYPYDWYRNAMEGKPPNDPFVQENSYVLLYITARQSPPTVSLLNLENIYDLGAWNDANGRYNNMHADNPNYYQNRYYPWIDRTDLNNKNGQFTLRVKATHAQGVESAEVYWIKEGTYEDGTTDRGRFIWDLANETLKNDEGAPVAGWETANNASASLAYSRWGYRDPNSVSGGIHTRRNFIFTYNNDGEDMVPSDGEVSGIHPQVAGKHKIQRYIGAEAQWGNRTTGDWSEENTIGSAKWENYKLTEGVYRIEVYARSNEGTPMSQPFVCSIRIDSTPPGVSFTGFEGAYGEATEEDVEMFAEKDGDGKSDLDPGDLIVNGVIRPSLLFSEIDSGLRSAIDAESSYYGSRGSEQIYILVKDGGDEVQLSKLISGEDNWWPPIIPGSSNDDLQLSGIDKVHKHGSVRNSRFLLKTSAIGITTETGLLKEPLTDGAYWLYVFARDNAFNVGHAFKKIVVKKDSDKPRFDFSETQVNDGVKNPNPADDNESDDDALDKGGFWVADHVNARNLLGSTQNIKIRIKDDDSLDLGTESASDPSKVEIFFYGTTQNSDGSIKRGPAISFGADVKALFKVQDGSGDNRTPVRERTGTIMQSYLLSLLNKTPAYAYLFEENIPRATENSLPDGVYKLEMEIADYPNAKLRMDDDTEYPAVAKKDAEIWFAVDSGRPTFVGAPQPATNTYPNISNLASSGVYGSVSDRNGPLSITYTIEGGTLPSTTPRSGVAEMETPDTSLLSTGIWQVAYKAPVDLSGGSGAFTITLNIRDRFGRTRSEIVRYNIDSEPPKVSLLTRIATVDRSAFASNRQLLIDNGLNIDHDATELDPITEISGPNLTRLANGVLRFIVGATDDTRLDTVRWWLVEATGSPVESFSGWEQTPVPGLSGNFNSNFNSTPQYIDTKGLNLPSGKYYLYAMAKDGGGNFSTGNSFGEYSGTGVNPLLQTIYIDQNSDLPFFSDNIVPSSGTTVSSAVLRGLIREDDGFGAGDNARSDSIRIWMSKNDSVTHAIDFTSDTAFAASLLTYGYSAPVEINPTEISVTSGFQNMTKQGNDISLNVNLARYFSTMFEDDGRKHYIIEAKDSSYGKYLPTGGNPITVEDDDHRVLRRMYYSFKYDTKPPVINVSSPAPNSSFTGDFDTLSFGVTGWMQDSNLDQVQDGTNKYYYFEYRLNGATEWTKFILNQPESTSASPLDPGTEHHVAPNYSGTETRVTFQIPPARARAILRSGNILSGNNTLLLAARDETGNVAYLTIPFFTDTIGPRIELRLKEVKLNELTFGGYTHNNKWWEPPTGANEAVRTTWYKLRREAVSAQDVPVIQKGTKLEGTFTDDNSEVGTTFRYGFDIFTDDTTIATTPLDKSGTTIFDPGDRKTARWEVDTSDLTDGLHSVQVLALDQHGNSTLSAMFAFRVVSGQPTVTLGMTDSVVHGDKTNLFFEAQGTAESHNLANVNLVIRHTDLVKKAGYTPYSLDLVPASGSSLPSGANATLSFVGSPSDVVEVLTWSLNVTRDILLIAGKEPGITSTALTQGDYEVSVVSIDLLGNESEEVVKTFTIDTSSPKVTFTGLYPSSAEITPYNATLGARPLVDKTLTGATPRVQATIEDTYSNLKAAQRQIRKYDYGKKNTVITTEGWTYYHFAEERWDYFASPPTDSAYWQDLPIATLGQYASMNWDLKDTTNGLGSLDDGFYAVRLRVKDSSAIGANDTWAVSGSVDPNGNPALSDYLYFFYASNPPVIEHFDSDKTLYSTSARINYVDLKVRVTDENRFNKLTVRVLNAAGTAVVSPAITVTMTPAGGDGLAERDRIWEPSVRIPFGTTYPDGSYRVEFTVSDMAGRSTTVFRTITLDNTAPTGSIDEPRAIGEKGKIMDGSTALYSYASEVQVGGEAVTISGTADDPNGIAEIWFHLGYGYDNTDEPTAGNSLYNNTNIAAFPADTRVKGYFTNNGTDTGVDTTGRQPHPRSAWFEYNNDTTLPPHFMAITVDSMFSWSLEMDTTAIAKYAAPEGITVKGTDYNAPGTATASTDGPWMLQRIDEDRIPALYRKDGLYSLPLWVRIVDTVGNVSYYAHDIWIHPNGDYPYSTINNPGESTYYENAGPGQIGRPRGGQISIDGTANDNVSVRKVIYRVKADNVRGANWLTDEGTSSIRTFASDSAKLLINDTADGSRIIEAFAWDENGRAALGNGWYVATLETAAGGQSVPWSFTLNANNEITDLIPNYGFLFADGLSSDGTSANRNMIRVRVEVYAFDDNGADPYGFNKVSLGGEDPGRAKPYVRVFYLQSSAPKINNPRISVIGAPNFTAEGNFGSSQGQARGGKFAIKANLDGSGEIGQIEVRLRQESDANAVERDWRTVYDSTGGAVVAPVGLTFNPVLPTTTTTSISATTLTWLFDSDSTTAGAANHKWLRGGGWATSGGAYTIDVRIRDTNNPKGEALYTFALDIDNFAPLADPRTGSNTPGKVAGTNALFTGRVFDYQGNTSAPEPPYRGIDRVLVWFTTNSNGAAGYINLNANTNTATTTTMQARRLRTASVVAGTGNNVTSLGINNAGGNPVAVTYPTNADYLKTLTKETSGIIWQPTSVGGMDHDVLWNFEADTTKMPDGRIYLNYLVVDDVGNASYYQQTMVVMNNYPQITNVTLRTDNLGVGAVFTTHEGDIAEEEYTIPETPFTAGYLNSGFISKNRFIAFGVDTIGGNGNLNYRVQYVQRVQIPLTSANLALMAGKTYTGTIPNTIGNTGVYTIREKGNLDDGIWATLGTHAARPSAGTHFVFQADTAYAATIPANTASVWGYRVVNTAIVKTTTTAKTPTGDNPPVTTTIPNANPDLAPSKGPLTFDDSTHFGTGTTVIREDLTGGAFFLIKVWDSVTPISATAPIITEDDMLYDAVVVGMSVYLNDITPPTARLYDLNPYTETAVVNNNFNPVDRTDTINAAADPIAIGSNILRGGLFNVKTERDVLKSGYIDPRSGTTALRPDIQDPNTLQWRPTSANGFVTGDVSPPVVPPPGSAINDKVSGRVILRGLAHDDQFVREIRIKIGADDEKAILRLTDLDAAGNPTTVTANIVRREMRPVTNSGTLEPAFAYEELHWKNGHRVEWAYVWDTEKEPTNAGGRYRNGVTIAVSVIDRNGTGGGLTSVLRGNLTDEATTRVYHNQINVDIVPYVVGFERASQYSTIRSRQGWYSFFQGETGIALLGYNLGTAAVAPGIAYTVNGTTETSMNTIAVSNDTNRFPFPLRYTFTVPATAVSGKINVTVTGAAGVTPATSSPAYNTSFGTTDNYTARSWNRENSTYTAGSDLWINRPHAHIWRTVDNDNAPRTYFGATGNTSNDPTSPGMALEYNTTVDADRGKLHAAWTSFGDATYYYGNNGASGTRRVAMQTAPAGDPFAETDISIHNGSISGTGNAPNISAVYQNDGAPYVVLRTTMTSVSRSDNATGQDGDDKNARISADATPRASERWRNTRIAKARANTANVPNVYNNEFPTGNNTSARHVAGRVYLTAYDAQSNYLWFGMRYNSAAAPANTHTNYTAIIDGVTGTAAVDGTTPINPPTTGTGYVAASANKGEFSAVDYDFNAALTAERGPVIAYYDQRNDTVRLACGTLGTDTYPTVANNAWTRRDLLPSTHPLYKGSGKYISIKVDKSNGIHLAFYNSIKETVVYAYMANRDTAADDVIAYTVDNVIKGGLWTDISVDDNGNPMIVYGNTSRIGNYDGVRIAYKNASGTAVGEKFTRTLLCPVTKADITGWEAVSMPASYTVKNDRLNIEAWPPTNRAGGTLGSRPTGETATANTWNAAVGYASDLYRIGYFYYPGYKGY